MSRHHNDSLIAGSSSTRKSIVDKITKHQEEKMMKRIVLSGTTAKFLALTGEQEIFPLLDYVYTRGGYK
ncbi:hypothetical protein TSAR_016132 [Trichomalopsis sarcophagae]|uniref:Uncharacterized protein n=1 Tax=Trichomalopsis sarcophagae TaxID=543379 RepID=A0A232FHU1_9HYME|nr:hypothetical protein TSAR_016132 [Trichomalopsis sarcophagae]